MQRRDGGFYELHPDADAAWRVTETPGGEREALQNAQGAPWYRGSLSQFMRPFPGCPSTTTR